MTTSIDTLPACRPSVSSRSNSSSSCSGISSSSGHQPPPTANRQPPTANRQPLKFSTRSHDYEVERPCERSNVGVISLFFSPEGQPCIWLMNSFLMRGARSVRRLRMGPQTASDGGTPLHFCCAQDPYTGEVNRKTGWIEGTAILMSVTIVVMVCTGLHVASLVLPVSDMPLASGRKSGSR